MRLGDLDALKEMVNKINDTDYGSIFDYTAHREVRNVLRDIKRLIDNTPTIEAEPVVRCKDCMYKEVPKCCPYQISGFAVPDDWYCPMGVKKNAAD